MRMSSATRASAPSASPRSCVSMTPASSSRSASLIDADAAHSSRRRAAGARAGSPAPAATRCSRPRRRSRAPPPPRAPTSRARRSARAPPAGAAAAAGSRPGTSARSSRARPRRRPAPRRPEPPRPAAGPDRLQPRHVAERAERRHPPPVALDRVRARVRRDPVQPGAEPLVALERCPPAPRPQQRLLDEVLGLLERPEHPVAVDVELPAVALGAVGVWIPTTRMPAGPSSAARYRAIAAATRSSGSRVRPARWTVAPSRENVCATAPPRSPPAP